MAACAPETDPDPPPGPSALPRIDWCAHLEALVHLPEGFTCLATPGYHAIDGFGTEKFPLTTRFKACKLSDAARKALYNEDEHRGRISIDEAYSTSFALGAGAKADLGELGLPFLTGVSVSGDVDRAFDVSVELALRGAHFEHLSNISQVFKDSPNADADCRRTLCEPDTRIPYEVYVAAPTLVIRSTAQLNISGGGAFWRLVKSRGSLERRSKFVYTLAADDELVLASHLGSAEDIPGSLCEPKWACIQPFVEIVADCEKGWLDRKSWDRKQVTEFGRHKVDAFCQHDAPNVGHAAVDLECTPDGSDITLRYSVDLLAKGGYTRHNDCPGGGSDDKCTTIASFTTFGGEASLNVPAGGKRYTAVVASATDCAGLLELSGPSGEALELKLGAQYRLVPGRYAVRFKGQRSFLQPSTDEDRYQRDCLLSLQLSSATPRLAGG